MRANPINKIMGDSYMDNEEKKLLKELKKSPNDGMCRVIELYMPAVKTICRHILNGMGNDVVDDVIQETFIKFGLFTESEKKIKGSIKGLIYQIARNQAIDKLRENKNRIGESNVSMDFYEIEGLISDLGANIEDVFARRYNFNLVHEVIGAMKEPDKKIFILRYFYNYKVREIALEVGIPEDNVESRIRRKRELLKKQLIERGVLYES